MARESLSICNSMHSHLRPVRVQSPRELLRLTQRNQVAARHFVALESESLTHDNSRFGVMLVPDPRQALAEMRRVVKPSRRAAVMVWGSAERNPFQSLPFAILRHLGVMPEAPAGPSGPFGLGDPDILASTIEIGWIPRTRRRGRADSMALCVGG